MSRATQVLTLLYPNGIPPAEYQTALMLAEIAQRAEATGAALKMPESTGSSTASMLTPEPEAPFAKPATKAYFKKRGALSVKTVASQSKVTPQTVYAAIKKGALRAKKTKSGEYRVKWADAEKWFGGVA